MNSSVPATVRRRMAISAAVLPLVIGGLAIATAGEVQASGCTHPAWSDKDSTVGHANASSTPIRTGPEGDCAQVALVGPAADLDYDCYVVNPAGKTWTHVRVMGVSPTIDGWVADVNLQFYGSSSRC